MHGVCLYGLYFDQIVLEPLSYYYLTIQGEESAFTANKILFEFAFKFLTIAEVKNAGAVFVIIFEMAFVVDPDIFWFIEVAEIEFFVLFLGILVVKYSLTVEGVMLPLPLVGDPAVGVVEGAFAMHLAIFPVAAILPSLIVVKYPVTVPESIYFSTLVPSFGELFLDVAWVGQIGLVGILCYNLGRKVSLRVVSVGCRGRLFGSGCGLPDKGKELGRGKEIFIFIEDLWVFRFSEWRVIHEGLDLGTFGLAKMAEMSITRMVIDFDGFRLIFFLWGLDGFDVGDVEKFDGIVNLAIALLGDPLFLVYILNFLAIIHKNRA